MGIQCDDRELETLFEEVMPGFRCLVTRQADGNITLQFQSIHDQGTFTLPALDPGQLKSPEKLEALCEQLVEEFLLICEQPIVQETEAEGVKLIRLSRTLADRLFTYFKSSRSPH
ncbi:hypothetical protein D9M71_761280 [compost metagenome]